MAGPLEGIRVLEWATHLNGPAAGYMLGDLGAEVIKLEQPGVGDPSRGNNWSYGKDTSLPGGLALTFEMANRSKKSITLNLKKEQGRQALYRLVEKSDVFFTNFHRSVQTSLGADYATLRRHNPRLIYGYNGSYGSRGPEGERRTFDTLIQARVGFVEALHRDGEAEPLELPYAIFDQVGGTMMVYGILAALVARERRGLGQEIEVSMLNSALHLLAYNVDFALWRGESFSRGPHLRQHPLRTFYRCADGQWLHLAETHADLYWEEFCQALGVEELGKGIGFATPEDKKRACQLLPIFEGIFATKSLEEWLRLFQERNCGFAYSAVNKITDLAQDPQALANEYIVDFLHPTMGQVKVRGVPVKFSQTPARIASPPPQFGQHTEEVLLEVGGYTWEELGQLREQGVI